ncbi:putative chromatin assembly factor 1 subunit B [Thermaerobacter marianensis DSM 12885]|uniref:Chromatin assembly factor 1 subunit B n=1 Tax=Thermaerobacter marianensis (strain ATCC 700841 / DSM 12885 / JCM 10246 / 7p75a) TaxID=644966 RepID=E6SH66_THEM7|nr:putative chromatin assembly factor 1 subunit B [Thermaerobacter marianensis DSM 12885]
MAEGSFPRAHGGIAPAARKPAGAMVYQDIAPRPPVRFNEFADRNRWNPVLRMGMHRTAVAGRR